MQIRNLSIFIVDDRPVATFLQDIFDVNITPYGWYTHCLEAASGDKQLAFDLMSADVNYSEDRSDPEWSPSLKGKFSCWGLVHALAALARRKTADNENNLMPFDWEIRSAAPQLVRCDPWAARLYGLLRSLAAQPKPDEDLPTCIMREHLEKWHKQLITNSMDQEVCDLRGLFLDDITTQDEQDSNLAGMLQRLLPKWRSKLLDAVKDGQVRLHLKTIDNCVKQLRAKPIIRLTEAEDMELCIPFSSSTGTFAYGIRLFSVLGDLIDREQLEEGDVPILDTRKLFDTLRINDADYSGPISILQWYDQLRVQVSGVQTPAGLDKEMLIVGDKLEECLVQNNDEAKAIALQNLFDSFSGEYTRIGMLYVLLVARRQLLGVSHTRHTDLENAYKISIGPQTISRPIRSQTGIFPQIGGPDRFAREVCNALCGCNHRLGAYWPDWIRPGLARWYRKYKIRIDPSGKNMSKFAPSLAEAVQRLTASEAH
jgi:hypothetical protein